MLIKGAGQISGAAVEAERRGCARTGSIRMSKSRMAAFSDAFLAIIITIMVLEIEIPHGAELTALRPLIPVFLSYALSFIYLGIYWTNHHHMLLDQSPPHAVCHPRGEWRDPVGQPAAAVLALAGAVRHG